MLLFLNVLNLRVVFNPYFVFVLCILSEQMWSLASFLYFRNNNLEPIRGVRA